MASNETSEWAHLDQNYTGNFSGEYFVETLPSNTMVTLSVIFGLSVLLSAGSNIMVALVLITGNRKKNTFNVFLLNLAISDWTLSTISLPFLFHATMAAEWKFGSKMCTAVPLILKVSQLSSIFTLTAIGIERYRAVVHPLLPPITTAKKTCAVAFIWLAALLISFPKLKFMSTVRYLIDGREIELCGERWPETHDPDLKVVYVWGLFTLTYMLPMVTLLVCYIRTGCKLLRDRIPGNFDTGLNSLQNRAKRKAFRTLVSVVILFAVCWLPGNLYNLVVITYNQHYLLNHQDLTMTLRACLYIWVVLTDALVNPIVYMFLSESFALEIRRLKLSCLKRLGTGVVREGPSTTRTRSTTYSLRSLTSSSKRSF
ncbi:tachykinin-like peptides receptor 86C [Ptychodera flava]|uniref:tachykinin-like peptides receptor 86C n=1 Tax=Ptychodera flava TaxID=63121 RepID=UPI00396A69AD